MQRYKHFIYLFIIFTSQIASIRTTWHVWIVVGVHAAQPRAMSQTLTSYDDIIQYRTMMRPVENIGLGRMHVTHPDAEPGHARDPHEICCPTSIVIRLAHFDNLTRNQLQFLTLMSFSHGRRPHINNIVLKFILKYELVERVG